ncbi:DUF2997 domain-containing protein [Patescibacteria group bacterium]|nr:DUF2997 domain-containing protein [Patescibacteria group bacterium]
MSLSRSIVVSVSPDGEVKVEAVGFKGGSCEKATQAIEKALGTSGPRTKKPEYFQQNTNQQKAGL